MGLQEGKAQIIGNRKRPVMTFYEVRQGVSCWYYYYNLLNSEEEEGKILFKGLVFCLCEKRKVAIFGHHFGHLATS